MKTIDLAQRSPEWHQWRAQGITASESAIILGRSPYKTPWRLWAERTGLAKTEDLSKNPLVQRGNRLEDAAREWFEQRYDTLVLPVCGESEEEPLLRASFDGLTDDGAASSFLTARPSCLRAGGRPQSRVRGCGRPSRFFRAPVGAP